MAQEVVDFQEGDRIKVISGAKKNNTGYVRYVGPLEGKGEDQVYIGVELDDPVGKHNGTVRGKTYFKCRDKYGYMAPGATFALHGKSKLKPRKTISNGSVKSATSLKSTDSKRSVGNATVTRPKMRDKSSSNTTSAKSSRNATPSKTPSKTPSTRVKRKEKEEDSQIDGSTVASGTASGVISKEATPQLSMPPQAVETTEIGIQTEEEEEKISISSEVKSVVDEMTLRNLETLKLREKELSEENKNLKLQLSEKENEIEDITSMTDQLSLRFEIVSEENELIKDKYEELLIKYETLQLDNEDLKDEMNIKREELAQELGMNTEQINQVLTENENLKKTMEDLQDATLKLIESKNNQIEKLKHELQEIPSLKERLLKLLVIEKRYRTMDADIKELQMELDLRLDSDRLIETLTSKNLELETSVHRMKDRIEFLEEVQFSNEELERESEMLVREYESELKGFQFRHEQLMIEYSKLQTELKNAQQTIFQFKNHIQKLEETKQRMSSMHDRMSMSKKEKEMEKEAIMRENIALAEKLEDLQQELIHNSMIAAQGFSHSVKSILIEAHMPKQINFDRNCIDFLSMLERYSFKVRFTKEFLDSFYVNGVRLTMTREKEKQLESIHELCPILMRHDRYIEAIERALVSSFVDKFDHALTKWRQFESIEKQYDAILNQCKENKIDGTIAVHQLIDCNKFYRTFLRDNFTTFDPDQPHRPHDKVDKWIVNESFGKLYYDLKLFGLKLNRARRDIGDLIEDNDNENIENNEKNENNENIENDNDNDNETVDVVTTESNVASRKPRSGAGERHILYEILQKMDQLQESVYSICNNVLLYTLPSRCSYFGTRTNLKRLDNDNYTGIEYQRMNELSNVMATVLSQQNKLVAELAEIDIDEPKFDKIGKINAALESQSEISELGIIPSLEKLYLATKDIPHTLKRLYSQSNETGNPSGNTSGIMNETERESESTQLYNEHMEMNNELKILYRRLSFRGRGIRTAAAENANESDEYTDPYDFSNVENEHSNIIGLPSTKLPPWFEKAKLIRDELESAGQLREQLETARCEIQARQKEVLMQQQQQTKTRNEIDIMKLQLAKEKASRQNLLHYEISSKELTEKVDALTKENSKLTIELQQTVSEKAALQRECERQKKTLFEFKTQGAATGSHNRLSLTAGHSPTKFKRNSAISSLSNLSNPSRLAFTPEVDFVGTRDSHEHSLAMSPSMSMKFRESGSMFNSPSSLAPHSIVKSVNARSLHQRSASYMPGMLSASINESLAMSPYDSGSDNEHETASLEYHQTQNYHLKTHLKETKMEIFLLKKTIGSLRKKIAQLEMNDKWETIKHEIRPLPSFSVLEDEHVKEYESRKRFYAFRKQLSGDKNRDIDSLPIASEDGDQSNTSGTSSAINTSDDESESENENENENENEDNDGGKTKKNKNKNNKKERRESEDGYNTVETKSDGESDVSVLTRESEERRKNKKRKRKRIGMVKGMESLKSKRVLHAEQHHETGQELSQLRKQFDTIWATPRVVDISQKSMKGQKYIARQYALRNLNEKVQQIRKNCLETKNAMLHSRIHHSEEKDMDENNSLKNKRALLGKVEINMNNNNNVEWMKSSSVRLNHSNLKLIAQYFNVNSFA